MLRLVRAMPMPDGPVRVHVGVDDWAEWARAHVERSSMGWHTEGMRKGCSYGTIVADLDRHRVVDLLPDRTAATLAGWRGQRPGIKAVVRDRSTEYARGATFGTPRAPQVADRWHLLANMRQAVERWLHGAHARLRHLPSVAGSAALPARRRRAFPRTASERKAGAESRVRWEAVYEEVRRRYAGGETLLGIARAISLARATVRRHAAADVFPARLPHGPGPSLLDPHVDYRLSRIGEGCENAMALWRELRERGYPGTSRQAHRFVAEPTRSGRKPRGEARPGPEPPAAEPLLPSARQLALAAGAADLGPGHRRGCHGGARRAGWDREGRRRSGAPLHGARARVGHGQDADRGPRCCRGVRCLDHNSEEPQRPRDRDLRLGTGRRRFRGQGCPDQALEQRAGRRSD